MRIPNDIESSTPTNILQYTKKTYEQLYKSNSINIEAMAEFTSNIQSESEEQNMNLPWNKNNLTLAGTTGDNFSVKGMTKFLKETALLNIENRSQLINDSTRNSWNWIKSRGFQMLRKIYTGACSIKPFPWAIGLNTLTSEKQENV
ncbi:8067_t:CDS:2 [Dentiscutata erythropus]|uniref:8067_t:CDS:1 n=1 Tax=Dentiscutata erythropus TaxID=1348616 RepID=A0A9N8YZM1_9GLOM|nr:8067_t:CDS:2 [Dentiscutata erythropus]